jgi:hypothetical protein
MTSTPPPPLYDLRISRKITYTQALAIVKTWSPLYTAPPIVTTSEGFGGDLVDVWVATSTRRKKDDTNNDTR